jgi:DNA-binding HxlR family transcriptional regulator
LVTVNAYKLHPQRYLLTFSALKVKSYCQSKKQAPAGKALTWRKQKLIIKRLQMKKNSDKYKNTELCPVRNVLDRFGDKWSLLVLIILGEHGTLRFNQLTEKVGDISQKMLTVTLRTLEADGLVSRKIYPEIPPKVEYTLTETGQELLPHIENLTAWALKNMAKITEAREKFASR